MAAAARLNLLDVKDDALFHMLGFFTHGGGKVRFTRVSRRARDVTRGTYPKDWLKWARALNEVRRRWVATLCTAPPVRSGFQVGDMVGSDPWAVTRSVGESDAVIGAFMKTAFASDAACFGLSAVPSTSFANCCTSWRYAVTGLSPTVWIAEPPRYAAMFWNGDTPFFFTS